MTKTPKIVKSRTSGFGSPAWGEAWSDTMSEFWSDSARADFSQLMRTHWAVLKSRPQWESLRRRLSDAAKRNGYH